MATVTTISYVATVLQILLQMQVDGLLTLTRIKERFLSQPSGGGDCCLNQLAVALSCPSRHLFFFLYLHVTICRLTQLVCLGWRDIMINITVAGTNAHICEIQVRQLTYMHKPPSANIKIY